MPTRCRRDNCGGSVLFEPATDDEASYYCLSCGWEYEVPSAGATWLHAEIQRYKADPSLVRVKRGRKPRLALAS